MDAWEFVHVWMFLISVIAYGMQFNFNKNQWAITHPDKDPLGTISPVT